VVDGFNFERLPCHWLAETFCRRLMDWVFLIRQNDPAKD